LTVLFCDVVDSAGLSDRLDPEDFREVLRHYHDAAGAVIARYGGHTAQVLGDGLLVYFGYPTAHEDDARRAVHSALELLGEVAALDSRLERQHGLHFAVRCGIHTGPVVAGDLSVGASRETLAVGQTPNIAARLQGLAEPNTVVVSGATHRLVGPFFDWEFIGRRSLKGIANDVDVYRAVGENDLVSPFEAAGTDLAPLVGRGDELSALMHGLRQACDGQGSAVLISGEPGVGKSRLLHAFRARAAEFAPRVLTTYGSPFRQATSLYPVTSLIGSALGATGAASPELAWGAIGSGLVGLGLDRAALPLAGRLLGLSPHPEFPDLPLSPPLLREQTLSLVVDVLLRLAANEPLVLILEDLHYVDPSTVEVVGRLLDRIEGASLLVVLTARPGFVASWLDRPTVTTITLGRLTEVEVGAMIAGLAGHEGLPPDLARRIVEKTDGVPLFVEELTKAVIEAREHLTADGAGSSLTFEVPSTLRDSLTARLDRLGPARGVAELAAVLGRTFSYEWLAAVFAGQEADLRTGLVQLERAEILFARGRPPAATYIFKHALIQDAAYGLLLKRTRRSHHRTVAALLTTTFASVAETQPDLVAHHYTEGGEPNEAIRYWLRAGGRAWEQSANAEGIEALRRAQGLVPDLPEAHRDQQALAIAINLGRLLCATRGYADPEVGETYARALALCEKTSDLDQRFWAYDGLHSFYTVRGELGPAQRFAERLLERADEVGDEPLLLEAHYKVGAAHFFAGRFREALPFMERAVVLGTMENSRKLAGPDKPAAYSRALSAPILWMLGSPDRARARAFEAIEVARELGHIQSVVGSLVMAATWTLLLLDDRDAIRKAAGEAIPAAHKYGLSWWLAYGVMSQAFVDIRDAEAAAAVAQPIGVIEHTIGALHAGGADLGRPIALQMLAEGYRKMGDFGRARSLVDECVAFSRSTDQQYWLTPTLLTAAEIELADRDRPGARDAAVAAAKRALSAAREQHAPSLELRALVFLATLVDGTPEMKDVRHDLRTTRATFAEGLGTIDMLAAEAILGDTTEASR
jgi:class 3 adenylate cyclase/tetratricopeptide (TPR) repeat protein